MDISCVYRRRGTRCSYQCAESDVDFIRLHSNIENLHLSCFRILYSWYRRHSRGSVVSSLFLISANSLVSHEIRGFPLFDLVNEH